MAEKLANEHEKKLTRELKGKQVAEQLEARATYDQKSSSSLSQLSQRATTSLSTAASQPDSNSNAASASSPAPSESNTSPSPPVNSQEASNPKPKARPSKPPTQPPNDNRFGPDSLAPPPPWYQRMWNHRPGTTAWTADEQQAHRSYIIPHPLQAMKNNLVRSWTIVLTPTWKLLKGMRDSAASGLPKAVLLEVWKMTADGGQRKLLMKSKEIFDKKVAEEEERQRQEREGTASSNNDRNGEHSS